MLYNDKGKTNFFVYDLVNRTKLWKHVMDEKFDQIQDMKYMLDNNTLIFSGVRSGQTDIYVYKIDKKTFEQVTNDVYDDLDPSFVAFPNKTGVLPINAQPNVGLLHFIIIIIHHNVDAALRTILSQLKYKFIQA